MAAPLTSIRLDTKLADGIKLAMGVKTCTEAVHRALGEAARLHGFKKLLARTGGKLIFAGCDE